MSNDIAYIAQIKDINEYSSNNGTEYIVTICSEGILSGSLKNMTGAEAKVMLVLMSMVNTKLGVCYPNQSEIAKCTGLARETVNRAMKSLEAKGIIHKVKSKNPKEKVFYSFSEINMSYEDATLLWEGTEVLEDDTAGIKNAKDFINYFCMKYQEKYGESYIPNYRIDGSMIKNKMIGKVSPEVLQGVIDTFISLYETRWCSTKYPRPNIYFLVNCVANECYAAYKESIKKEKEMEQKQEEVDDSEKFLSMFGGEE